MGIDGVDEAAEIHECQPTREPPQIIIRQKQGQKNFKNRSSISEVIINPQPYGGKYKKNNDRHDRANANADCKLYCCAAQSKVQVNFIGVLMKAA